MPLFFIACSDDDNGGKGEENKYIDKAILGKWKVEYSKYSDSARYNEETGEFTDSHNAKIVEYFGTMGEINGAPKCGMFDMNEVDIEIKEDNTILVYIANANHKTVYYRIENGYMIWNGNTLRYSINDDELIIELLIIGSGMGNGIATIHSISRYSKIIE